MSTGYRPLKFISFEQLTDGRLEKYGVWEGSIINPREGCGYLADRDGLLVAYKTDDCGSAFVRYARNRSVAAILDAIEEEFDTEIISDKDHRYWGFETAEEYEAAYEKLAADSRSNFQGSHASAEATQVLEEIKRRVTNFSRSRAALQEAVEMYNNDEHSDCDRPVHKVSAINHPSARDVAKTVSDSSESLESSMGDVADSVEVDRADPVDELTMPTRGEFFLHAESGDEWFEVTRQDGSLRSGEYVLADRGDALEISFNAVHVSRREPVRYIFRVAAEITHAGELLIRKWGDEVFGIFAASSNPIILLNRNGNMIRFDGADAPDAERLAMGEVIGHETMAKAARS